MARDYKRKDHLYRKAKDEGYRSRAAYKLFELDRRYGIFFEGAKVLDLGSWPGGWLQVAAELVADLGLVVGIDLVQIDPLREQQVELICGDVADDDTMKRAIAFAAADGFDIVLSDMSPKLTGIREADSAAVVGCAELAFWAAGRALRQGGTFVIKLFKGNDVEQFYRTLRPCFEKLTRTELKASRGTSNEFYCVGSGFKR